MHPLRNRRIDLDPHNFVLCAHVLLVWFAHTHTHKDAAAQELAQKAAAQDLAEKAAADELAQKAAAAELAQAKAAAEAQAQYDRLQ